MSREVTRTCIGCRVRASAADLLRVVVDPAPSDGPAHAVTVVPDPRRRAQGRGAWLHPDPDCVSLAERRRAFGRSLRLGAVTVDSSEVRSCVDPVPVVSSAG